MLYLSKRFQEECHANEKKLYMCFVDLEEAYYGILLKVMKG